LPTSNLIDPARLAQGAGFHVHRTDEGWIFDFPVLRAPGPAFGLLAFAALCALMPALGLSALLPLESANAAAVVSLALIGGFAAPFILASVVFAGLALYMLANSLRVEIRADRVDAERRLLGYMIRRSSIARADIADIEPRISARFQNLLSATPRYALIAKHTLKRSNDIVIAEDLAGDAIMLELRALACATLDIK
jgi:hypothetical protein